MKAAVVTRYGPPEVVVVQEVPKPVPGEREVLIRVHASTVCFGERMIRLGPWPMPLFTGLRKPRRPILGADMAGTVETVGKLVTKFAPGDQVFGSPMTRFGAHAEYLCLAETAMLAPKPRNMTLEEAGTLFVGGITALHFVRKAAITPGEKVLVHAASGSVGTFAIQLAKYYGAHVTALCSAANHDLVKSLGADAVIDYKTHDFIADGPRYDVICDIACKAGFPRSLQALKRGGRYLLIGMADGVMAVITTMMQGRKAQKRGDAIFITGAAKPTLEDLDFLKSLIEAGKLRTVIGRRYALADIVAAHRYADSGHKVGNVVVVVTP